MQKTQKIVKYSTIAQYIFKKFCDAFLYVRIFIIQTNSLLRKLWAVCNCPRSLSYNYLWGGFYMRKKILSIFLVIFMVMSLFPTKSKAVTEYSLWVGGTRVTDDNKDDILGDSTCSFDPESNTLTLNNANITGGYSTHNIHVNNENISDLKISLKGTNSLNGQSFGVYSYYTNLTIDGSQGGTLETTGSISGIQANFASITIKNVDNLYAKSSGRIFGLDAIAGNSSPHALKIENSTVTAHSDENAGIYTHTKPFIITGNI